MTIPELPTELWWTILGIATNIWTDDIEGPSRLVPEAITKRWLLIGGSSTRSEQMKRDILASRRARRSLVLVCRMWYNLIVPYLYRHLTLLPNKKFSLSNAIKYTHRLDIFDCNAYLATTTGIADDADTLAAMLGNASHNLAFPLHLIVFKKWI
jgi:hypothetical protein